MKFFKNWLKRKQSPELATLKVSAVTKGLVYPLSHLKDDVFAKGIIGPGLVIKSQNGKIYAPFDGTMATVFRTRHAYGIKHENGLSLLIHIGIGTSQLQGEGFFNHVSQDEKVKKGQMIAEFDYQDLQARGVVDDVIVVIPKENEASLSHLTTKNEVSKEDQLFIVSKN